MKAVRVMRITNRTRNTLVGGKVTLTSTRLACLRGYVGRPEPRPGEGILLLGCNSIRRSWISFDLDVLLLDDNGRVLKVFRSLRPWRRTGRVQGARYVLGLPVGTVEASDTRVGDELTWRDSVPYSITVLSSQGKGSSRSRRESGSSPSRRERVLAG